MFENEVNNRGLAYFTSTALHFMKMLDIHFSLCYSLFNWSYHLSNDCTIVQIQSMEKEGIKAWLNLNYG